VAVLVSVSFAYFTTPKVQGPQTVTYAGTHTLAVNPQATQTLNLSQAALLVKVGEVPRRVAEQVGYAGSPAALAATVEAAPDAETGTLAVTAKATKADVAAKVADAFAQNLNSYLDERNKATRQQSVDEAQRRLNDLKAQTAQLDAQIANPRTSALERDQLTAERDALINQYRLTYDQYQQIAATAAPAPPFVTLEPATGVAVSDTAFRAPSSRSARMLLAVALALVLGAGLALLLERVDIRIRTKEGAEEAFGFPVVAEVPVLGRGKKHEIQTVTRPASPFAEAYRVLRTLLLLVKAPIAPANRGVAQTYNPTGGERPIEVILVTSPGAAEGKTTTVAHLAAALAEAGRSVLVLSCDFRRPRIHRMFDVEEGLGLTDVLAGGAGAPSLDDVVRPTNVRGVSLIHSGTAVENPAELVAAGRNLLAQTRRLADVVLIDTAPLLVANDASELMPSCDAVLIVSRAGKTSADAASRTAELLERVHAPVLGVVLVAAPQAPTANRYYYYRYYIHTEGVFGWRRWLGRKPKTIKSGSLPRFPVTQDGGLSNGTATTAAIDPKSPPAPEPRAAEHNSAMGVPSPSPSSLEMPPVEGDEPKRRPVFEVERLGRSRRRDS
jgi:capsular exopolysaccharide synthesis family protein